MESSTVISYQLHTHTLQWLQCMYCMASIYRLDLNFGLSMHSLSFTLAWRKQLLMFANCNKQLARVGLENNTLCVCPLCNILPQPPSNEFWNFWIWIVHSFPLFVIFPQLFDFCLSPDTSGDGTGCDNMTCVIVEFHHNGRDSMATAIVGGKRKSAEDGQETESKKPRHWLSTKVTFDLWPSGPNSIGLWPSRDPLDPSKYPSVSFLFQWKWPLNYVAIF